MKSFLFTLIILYCSSSSYAQETVRYKDERDGKIYKTVKIGNYWILAQNFAYKPDNGKYWCIDKKSNSKCGYLYDWETAKKIIPKGWHLPSQDEWNEIIKISGNDEKMTYDFLIKGGKSGFNVLICGWCDDKGVLHDIGIQESFWGSTDMNIEFVWCLNIYKPYEHAYVALSSGNIGKSIRLIKD